MKTKSNGPYDYLSSVLERIKDSDLSDAEICRRAGLANSTMVRLRSSGTPTITTLIKIEMVLDREAEMKRAGESSA